MITVIASFQQRKTGLSKKHGHFYKELTQRIVLDYLSTTDISCINRYKLRHSNNCSGRMVSRQNHVSW